MERHDTVALGDLADQLGVGSDVLLREIDAGDLAAVKVDGRLRVPVAAAAERLSRPGPASPPSASR